jgi:hypothetical protein
MEFGLSVLCVVVVKISVVLKVLYINTKTFLVRLTRRRHLLLIKVLRENLAKKALSKSPLGKQLNE